MYMYTEHGVWLGFTEVNSGRIGKWICSERPKYRYRVSDIGDIGEVEDIGLSVFAAYPIRYVICTLLPGTNQLMITQASCCYARLPMHGMQNCVEQLQMGRGGKCCRGVQQAVSLCLQHCPLAHQSRLLRIRRSTVFRLQSSTLFMLPRLNEWLGVTWFEKAWNEKIYDTAAAQFTIHVTMDICSVSTTVKGCLLPRWVEVNISTGHQTL